MSHPRGDFEQDGATLSNPGQCRACSPRVPTEPRMKGQIVNGFWRRSLKAKRAWDPPPDQHRPELLRKQESATPKEANCKGPEAQKRKADGLTRT